MVSTIFKLLRELCGCFPDEVGLYVCEFFTLRSVRGMVQIKDVVALLGYLDAGSMWQRSGVEMPDINSVLQSDHKSIHVSFVVFLVFRLADHSVACFFLAKRWSWEIARIIDSNSWGGKLVSDLPVMKMPKDSVIDWRRALRGDDKYLLSCHGTLVRHTGFNRSEDQLLRDRARFFA